MPASAVAGLLAGLLLAGCGSLDTAGVYHGDKTLCQADFAMVTSYDTLHSFVRWEYEHRAALAGTPAIRAAADRIRAGAPHWFSSALALRDACQANPTAANYAALERAMAVIHQAVLEAMKYLTMDNGSGGSPLSRLTEQESAASSPGLVPAPSNQATNFSQF